MTPRGSARQTGESETLPVTGSRPIDKFPEFFERRALAHEESRDSLHVRIGVRHEHAGRVDISVS